MENFSFRIQDVFRVLVPGIILLVFVISNFGAEEVEIQMLKFKDLESVVLLIFIAFSIFFGYGVDMLSSLLEKLIYHILKKPSYHFLNETWWLRLFFSKYKDKNFFINEAGTVFSHNLSYDANKNIDRENSYKFFNYCNGLKERVKNEKTYEKLNSYLYSTILSRNLTALLFIIFLIKLIELECLYSIILLLLLLLSLHRWLKLSFNYTRQVFIICESLSNIESEEKIDNSENSE